MPHDDHAKDLLERALSGERLATARLISIVEDGTAEIGAVMGALFPHTGKAYTIGITGAPGAGKSTLTETLVARIRKDDRLVAVLAVDPSSPFTGGALLGDRVRMQAHATDPGVFIRSMATRGHLGGLALATPEAVRVLDASGYEYIIVETVGVGQAEVGIVEAADTTLVVVNPGWGDSVQAGKAGLLEVADVFVVNKADRQGTRQTVAELKQMLRFRFELDHEQGMEAPWTPPIVQTVATESQGIDELWDAVSSHRGYLESSGELARKRRSRISKEITDIAVERVRARVLEDAKSSLDALVSRVERRELDPYAAAESLMDKLDHT